MLNQEEQLSNSKILKLYDWHQQQHVYNLLIEEQYFLQSN